MKQQQQATVWPETMKVLWIGNAVVANLAEPLVQLEQLEKELPNLQSYLATGLDDEKRSLVINELRRQLQYLNQFHEKIQKNMTVISSLAEGGEDSVG